MIERIYMSITGQQQGLISKGCSSEMSIGDKYNPEHLNEITLLSVAYPELKDDGTALFTGLFTITKYRDAASPLLPNAWKNGELLSCEINFYRNSQTDQEKIHSLKLVDAEIFSLDVDSPDISSGNATGPLEHIGLRARFGTAINH